MRIWLVVLVTMMLTACGGGGGSNGTTTTVNKISSPSGVATYSTANKNVISWSSVEGATSYNVYWSTSPNITKSNSQKIVNASSPYVHEGVTDKVTYYYGISALKDGVESDLSSTSEMTSSKVVSLDASGDNIIALKSDGTVWTWGHLVNWEGHSDSGSFYPISPFSTNSSVPKRANALTSVTKVAAGSSHYLALKSDGTLWAFGDNTEGQLGDGTTTSRVEPVRVFISDVIAISASDASSVALKSDGTVWAWGADVSVSDNGTSKSAPVQVAGLTDVAKIKASGNGGYAIKRDGTLWGWGGNVTSPVLIPNISNVSNVIDGYAVTTGGTAYSWGTGVIGDVTGGPKWVTRSTPGLITGLTEVSTVSNNFVVVKNDMTVWAFVTGTSTFSQVSNFDNAVTAVAVDHGMSTLVLTSDGSLYGWGQNNYALGNGGAPVSYLSPIMISGI